MSAIKVSSVTPLDNMSLLVTFDNGVAKVFDVRSLVQEYPEFLVLENADIFALVQVEPGGYGISWSADLDCSEGELWENGVTIPLSTDDLLRFVRRNVLITAEASETLNCTRQNLDDLVRRGKLTPVKTFPKGKLFFSGDLQRRKVLEGG